MPKNIIPKDNIPKIEEIRMIESDFDKSQQVREVEKKTPTYEEFMDNYQQEQVNYEDLTYRDVGSSKTYGPMPQTWAEHNTERFTLLKIPCLEINCSNTEAFDWRHSSCGGSFQISNRGRLKCNGCSLVEDIKNFSFKCSNHSRSYMSTSQMDISALKRVLFSALSQGAMDEGVTMDLIQHLGS